jgi:hypothetical protein
VFLIESFKKYIHEKIRSLFNDSTKFVIFKWKIISLLLAVFLF